MYFIKVCAGNSYLCGLNLTRWKHHQSREMDWTEEPKDALRFEDEEEAQAVIDFIGNVLAWETAESLEVEFIR